MPAGDDAIRLAKDPATHCWSVHWIIGSPDTATRKSGMQDYLDNNTTVPSCEITEALHKAATNTGTTLVLHTADDNPAERVRGLLRENEKKRT